MKNSSLIFIICVALTFVFFQAFTWPQYNEYKKLDLKAKDLNVNLQAILDHKKSTQEAYEKIMNGSFSYKDSYGQEKSIKYTDTTIDGQKKNSVLEAALPDRMFLPALFNLYYTVARGSGTELEAITAQEQDKKRKATGDYDQKLQTMGVAWQNVSLTITGPYQRFRDFLRGIEQSSRFIEIENIEFAVPQKGKEKKDSSGKTIAQNIEDSFQFKISTKVYYMNK